LGAATLETLETFFAEGEVREALVQTLRDLFSLDELGEKTEIQQFREILSQALEEISLPVGAFQKAGVCLSELMPARGLSFRAVFLPGMVERAFPPPIRQDPLLLDQEREEINRSLQGKGRAPLKKSRFQEELLLFALAAGAARQKLILSYPRLDPLPVANASPLSSSSEPPRLCRVSGWTTANWRISLGLKKSPVSNGP